jgi:uncharacterized protein (DUF362 family)
MRVMVDSVALLRCEVDLKSSLRESLGLIGGFGSLRSPFIVKPNICSGSDGTGCANVDVSVVEALIKLALEKDEGLSVKIVESDSESKYADEAFTKFGYRKMEMKFREEGYDVSVLNLSKSPLTKIGFDGAYFKDPELPAILTEHGYVVSVERQKRLGGRDKR